MLAYDGNSAVDLHRFEDAADMLCRLVTLHGLADLVLAEKATHFFGETTSQDFVSQKLPEALARLYPSKKEKRAGNMTQRKRPSHAP